MNHPEFLIEIQNMLALLQHVRAVLEREAVQLLRRQHQDNTSTADVIASVAQRYERCLEDMRTLESSVTLAKGLVRPTPTPDFTAADIGNLQSRVSALEKLAADALERTKSIDPHTDDFEYTEEDSAAFRRELALEKLAADALECAKKATATAEDLQRRVLALEMAGTLQPP